MFSIQRSDVAEMSLMMFLLCSLICHTCTFNILYVTALNLCWTSFLCCVCYVQASVCKIQHIVFLCLKSGREDVVYCVFLIAVTTHVPPGIIKNSSYLKAKIL